MNYITHRFSLDVNKTSAQLSLACKQNDTAIQLRIKLTDNGKPYHITDDCTALFTATKPDGTALYNYCIIENNTIVYSFTDQTVSCKGRMNVEIRLSGEEGVITSPSFILIVDEPVLNEYDVLSSSEATALVGLVGKTNIAISEATAATAAARAAVDGVEETAQWLSEQVGRAIEMQYDPATGYLQYRLIGDTEWANIVDMVNDLGFGISEATGGALNLSGDGVTVDNAVARLTKLIYDGFGGAIIEITLQGADGTPIPNGIIGGVSSLSGGVAKTDANGKVTAVSLTDNPTLTFGGDFADLEESSQVVTVAKGENVAVTLIPKTKNFADFTQSTSVKISALCTRLDVSLLGGGGGGDYFAMYSRSAGSPREVDSFSTGGGGAGGDVTTKENVSFVPGQEYEIIVGAGGTRGEGYGSSGRWSTYTPAGTGGTTSAFGLSAAGGAGAPPTTNSATQSPGATGNNGNGGGGVLFEGYYGDQYWHEPTMIPTAGTKPVYISFTETAIYGGGGAGGAIREYNTEKYTTIGTSHRKTWGAVSTAGYGAAYSYSSGNNAADGYGGGGGGCGAQIDWDTNESCYSYEDSSWGFYGGNGGSGRAAIRMWH